MGINDNKVKLVQIKANGVLMDAMGDFTLHYGKLKGTIIHGSDGRPIGVSQEPTFAGITGKVMDSKNLDLNLLFTASGITVTARKGNGKTFVLQGGVYAGESTLETADSGVDFTIHGESAEDV